ncbi:hypothetical protein QYE76_060324 [Lolium multiflorum]|uniref:Disease resistance N-terminal domain-containing protein n=1 Tax=Lolium multiflorum TaxID=4521 RepID=A0AAD8RZL0_LOLMU|nr:hypothetical protein QYE76_060324 [Lolium multiflorum]
METAIGAANWLVGKVLNKLSDDLIAAYAASSELGFNSEQIKTKLMYVQGLLHVAKERDVSSNPGLQNLLEDLSKKADKAEDTLDELHYFLIQDQLEGASPELGHCCLAARHNIELTMDGFNPLMTVNLKELIIYNNNYRFTDKESISIARDLLSEVGRSKLMHAGSFQLERVNVDSIMALLIAPICSHLAGTLYKRKEEAAAKVGAAAPMPK